MRGIFAAIALAAACAGAASAASTGKTPSAGKPVSGQAAAAATPLAPPGLLDPANLSLEDPLTGPDAVPPTVSGLLPSPAAAEESDLSRPAPAEDGSQGWVPRLPSELAVSADLGRQGEGAPAHPGEEGARETEPGRPPVIESAETIAKRTKAEPPGGAGAMDGGRPTIQSAQADPVALNINEASAEQLMPLFAGMVPDAAKRRKLVERILKHGPYGSPAQIEERVQGVGGGRRGQLEALQKSGLLAFVLPPDAPRPVPPAPAAKPGPVAPAIPKKIPTIGGIPVAELVARHDALLPTVYDLLHLSEYFRQGSGRPAPEPRIGFRGEDGLVRSIGAAEFRALFGVEYAQEVDHSSASRRLHDYLRAAAASGSRVLNKFILKQRQNPENIRAVLAFLLEQPHAVDQLIHALLEMTSADHPDEGSQSLYAQSIAIYGPKIARGFRSNTYIARVNDRVGWGLFAGEDIRRWQMITTYTGKLVEIRDRETALRLVPNRYLHTYMPHVVEVVLDAEKSGNEGRFINHSSGHENARTLLVFFAGRWHTLLVAEKEIKKGQQILYDYGPNYADRLGFGPEDLRP